MALGFSVNMSYLDALLEFIPFWGITKTKVTPLQDWEARHDQDRQGTEQMEQSLQ